MPSGPSKPNRKLILAGGVAGGMAAGIGLIFLMELFNRAIRRPVELTNALGMKPFATLPYMMTGGQRTMRTFIIVLVLLVASVGVPAGLFFVHTNIMPIDVIVDKVRGVVGI